MDSEAFKHYSDKVAAILQRQLFFVMGCEKSGTTWLQHMLDAHRTVVCAGEGHYITDIAKPMQQMVNAHNRSLATTNQQVYGDLQPSYKQVEPGAFHAGVIFNALLSVDRELTDEVKFFGDKTPAYVGQIPGLHLLFPKAKYFHIVRDGRDVLISYVKHRQRSEPEQEWSYAATLDYVAAQWKECMQKARAFAAAHPDLYCEIRYEDLKAEPEKHLKAMHAFLGVESTDDEICECVAASSFESMSGGRKAGDENSQSFLRKGVAGDWKTTLALDEMARFQAIAGDMLQQLGYET